MKKIIIALFVIVILMFCLPSGLYANGDVNDYTITVVKTATGFTSGGYIYKLIYFNPYVGEWKDLFTETIGYDGGSVTFKFSSDWFAINMKVVESEINGADGVDWSYNPSPKAAVYVINNTTDSFLLNASNTEKTIYFDNVRLMDYEMKSLPRNHEMTCYQIWINGDNNFEFVFWWEYANNNWVKIYNMEGSEVFSIDMENGSAHFEADLPDGTYIVKTFHDGFETPIQEFIIGKP